jgi:hypothetical protein
MGATAYGSVSVARFFGSSVAEFQNGIVPEWDTVTDLGVLMIL